MGRAGGYWQLRVEGNFPPSAYGEPFLSSNVDYSFPPHRWGSQPIITNGEPFLSRCAAPSHFPYMVRPSLSLMIGCLCFPRRDTPFFSPDVCLSSSLCPSLVRVLL